MKSLRLVVVAVLLAVVFAPAMFAADQPTVQAQPVVDLFQSTGQCVSTPATATGEQPVLPILMPTPEPAACQCTAAKKCSYPGCICSNPACGICLC